MADVHPGDWRAWLFLALATRGTPAAASAIATMCALAKHDPALVLPPGLCADR